jgi:fibronectin-binding autotransporter adhesin
LGANTGSAGKITGGASLTQNGASQLTLQTVNDYLGGTVINAGTVQLGNNFAAAEDGMVGGNGAVVIGAAGSLVVSNFATETLSGLLSGSGQLVQQGNGKLILTGNNSAFTGTIIATNFLQMGNGVSGTLSSGPVTNNRTLLLNVGPTPFSTVPVAANIGGSGNVTNIGIGVALLAGTNTWAGNTVIPEGTIKLGSGAALPANTALYMDCNNTPGLVGTLDLNGFDVTIGSLAGNNTGNGNITLVEPVILNNAVGAGTNTLTVAGGTTTTFNGELLDNNLTPPGTGKLKLNVINDTTLTLNACVNNAVVNTFPNLFTGGITVSNATLVIGTTLANYNGPEGVSSAGVGPITLMGGLGTVTNGMTRMPTNGMLIPVGAQTGNNGGGGYGTVLVGPVIVPAGQSASLWLPQRNQFSCTLQGAGTLIVQPNYVRGGEAGDWSAFTGTIIFEAISISGTGGGTGWVLNHPLGFPNATLYMQTLNSLGNVSISGANGGAVVPIGALSGGDSTSLIGGGTQGNGSSGGAANTIWAIGGLNLSTTNGSQIVDGGCGIRKVGTGTLTLTNNTLSFGGQCVVSNGTLAFAPLGTNTDGSPVNYTTNTTYLVGTNFTIVDPGILDMSHVGDHTLHIGHNGTQTFFGDGTIIGNLIVTNNLIAPAWGVNSRGTFPGNLRITGNAEIDLNSTLQMAVSPTNYDSLTVGGTLTINRAKFTVISTGGTAFASGTNVFRFFSAAVPVNVGGASGITNITVFTNLPAGMFWVTNLDGTLNASQYPTVPAGAMAIVNTNAAVVINPNPSPVQVTVNGNQLTLGWAANLGWILQSQTNNASVGLSTNWVDVAGSALVTNVVITINPNSPSVFYRLRSPP